MNKTTASPDTDADEVWPALPYDAWTETRETLHMWAQIVGKVKLALAPFLNEWWQVPFTITPRGWTTSTIPFGRCVFAVNFDFIDHQLEIHVSDGAAHTLPLAPRSVADFYQEFMGALHTLGIDVQINTMPVEVENDIPFDQDHVHAAYDREFANRFWRVLLQVDRLLQRYRSPFAGKSSPSLFWWGSFDLAVSRFSGRPAPPRDWPTRWMALSAGHEYANAGFWPGSSRLPTPAFYAYTYPEPPGIREAVVRPKTAYFDADMGEFILRYDDIRQAASPDSLILDFFDSTYEAGAILGGWDRAALERPFGDVPGT
jgi:hypothetical protein